MADFIAVIRRAVDGLSDNTPEMRARVYEKARSAVQRQLDNMKPRPADDVIARQMDKVTEAIEFVEAQFSSAPPAPEPETIAPEPEIVETAAAPEPAYEPVQEPEPAPEPVAEPVQAYVAETHDEPAHEEVEETVEPEPEHVHEVSSPVEDAAEPPAWDAAPHEETVQDESPEADEPEPDQPAQPTPYSEPHPVPDFLKPAHTTAPQTETIVAQTPADDTMPPAATSSYDPIRPATPADDPFAAAAAADIPAFASGTQSYAADIAPDAQPSAFAREIASQEAATPPLAKAADSWTTNVQDNPFDEPEALFGISARTPPAKQAMLGVDDVWGDFERSEPPRQAAGRDGLAIPGLGSAPRSTAAAHKPEREGRGKVIAAILGVLIVVAGAGYTGWRFSDNILNFVNSSASTTQKQASTPATTTQPASQTPANSAQTPATTAPNTDVASKPADAAKPADQTKPVVTAPQKFTQRLMTDGSEVETGDQGIAADAKPAEEGKSVASQNVKAPDGGTAPAAQQDAGANSATPPKTDKVFLYEERLGQTSPTALDGTVSWSVKSDDSDGHPQKVIQGDISVPGRKLAAVMTIKQNTDPSLPASHIIEVTFSLPKDFEGGGIDSIVRVSMKEKEQDKGDPLVAVPAKITDYFHMIALNSYGDAVKTNLDLLKTRDWIDIPLTYTNGRRALITLQKGPEGAAVFDEVIGSWGTPPTPAPVAPAPAADASAPAAPAPAAAPVQ